MLEKWKPVSISAYEGLYEVSNLGRVRSLDRVYTNSANRVRRLKGKILQPVLNGAGYLFVGLSHKKCVKQVSVHRLVALAFNKNPHSLPQVNHKNGIKTDNRACNLKWCTGSENIQHALNTGLKPRGESINTNILSETDIKDICHLLDTSDLTQKAIGQIYGVHKDTIGAINTGKNWNWLTGRKK